MRQLRLVHLSDDGDHLVVETDDGNERFSLPVDPVLRGAVRPAAHRAEFAAPPTSSAQPASAAPGQSEAAISPREIQVRVRAGETPESVAQANGMTLERVLRFAAPVVAERLRIAAEARRARARRSTTDGQVVVFGEAVDDRFVAHGIAAAAVSWDSHRRADGEWVIVATWLGGEGTHTAQWLFDRTSRSVAPADETAVDLLSDRPIRPVLAPEPQRPALAAAPPLVAGIVAFPPMPDAHTGPLPVLEDVFDQDAAPEGPRDLPPLVPAASGTHQPEPAPQFEELPLPLAITDAAGRPAAAGSISTRAALSRLTDRDAPRPATESEDDRAARARVPSWDDILLGVRRKTD